MGEWIGIALSMAVALISVGTSLARLASARSSIRKLERSAERQGFRLGELEGDVRVIFDRIGGKRRQTAAQGVPHAIDDEGSE